MTRPVRRLLAVAAAAAVLVLPACGADTPAPTASGPAGGSSAPAAPITVFAAASLTEAFTRIGADFEARSGSTVTFSFASSATLATQITSGAPADVFAAASPATMKTVTDAGRADGAPVNFVSNTLQIAVPRGNPGQVTGLADFADESRTIVICDPSVPCGAAAATVFQAAGITPRPDDLGQDVKDVLAKVAADEVDAVLVYRTDVIAAAGKVEGIEFPEASRAVNRYPIAVLTESRSPDVARAFVDHVRSAEGRAVFEKAGFGQP